MFVTRLSVFGSAEICSLWLEWRSSRRWLECVVVVPLCFYRLEAAAQEPLLLLFHSTGFLRLLFLVLSFFFMIIVYITKKTRVSLLYANDWASIQRKRKT